MEDVDDIEISIVCLESGIWRVIKDFSLVLASQKIPHFVRQSEQGPWELMINNEYSDIAQTQINLYKQENPHWELEQLPMPTMHSSVQPLYFLLIPAICTFLQAEFPQIEPAGIADARLILKGEWWRVFTAQTLHANSLHLVSNLISGFFAFTLLSIKMPLSRIAPIIALAAGLANLEVAFIMGNYMSLGFSTTVFATFGAMATIEVRNLFRTKEFYWRNFVPWFAAFLLAVFLGIGNEFSKTDIFGHFFGLAMGAIAGFIPPKKWLVWGSPIEKIDVLFVFLLYFLFAFSWYCAIN